MDEQAMTVGLLVEAAHSQQQLAEGTLQRLAAAVHEIGEAARAEIRSALITELRGMQVETRQAIEALRTLKRAAHLRTGLWSMGIFSVSSLIALGGAWWTLPSSAEVAQLRVQRDDLSSAVSRLVQRGGRVDLRRCGVAQRLCVRVDRKAPVFGESSEYFIVKGY